MVSTGGAGIARSSPIRNIEVGRRQLAGACYDWVLPVSRPRVFQQIFERQLPMPDDPSRIAREKRTMGAMLRLYCRKHHGGGALCGECSELLEYATCRLDRCPFGPQKTTCAKCPVHCYKPRYRERVKEVMRFSGPRMLLYHPILAVRHLLDGRRLGSGEAES